jgi:enoyl-CoA hydratase
MRDDTYEYVEVASDEPVERAVTIRVNRPDARNALNDQVRGELIDAMRAAAADDGVRVVVLTGAEDAGAFVAGADITEFEGRSVVEQRAAGKRPRVYEVVDRLEKPVVARINGHALGGGMELALACDVRIAREGAKLGQPEINLGIIPGGGGTQRLARLVGEGQAMRLVLSGELVDATEAADIGMVDEVCTADAFDDRIAELCGNIAEKSPIAVELAKKAVRAGSRMPLDEGIEYEAELFAVAFSTADRDEGVAAFLEKRDPEFEGR